MKPAGGLKLALQKVGRDDRRVRFAEVLVAAAGDRHEIALVTDADGRLRYRLIPGEYRLRVQDSGEARFTVRDRGWTTVRFRLP
jgi:hypothetical protein